MRAAGYSIADAGEAGWTLKELRSAGFVEGLKVAGFTIHEAKEAGYTCSETKAGGYFSTCGGARAVGYNPRECMQAGFTFDEGKAAGYAFQDEEYASYWRGGEYDWDGKRVRTTHSDGM